jgi:RND family efflux transporter MFP subunit
VTDGDKAGAEVTAPGTLSPIAVNQVRSQVSGRVSALRVDHDAAVKEGQVLAEIEPNFFQAAVEQAQAALVTAQGNYEQAAVLAIEVGRRSDRLKALLERNQVEPSVWETAEASAAAAAGQQKAAEGVLLQAQVALKQAEMSLACTRIVSPSSGVVLVRNVDVGQAVTTAPQLPPLFIIAQNLTKMQVDTDVSESDVGRLRAGMRATLSVDAYPGEIFQGMVRQIHYAPRVERFAVTYDAVVEVPNPELKLRPGMSARVTFVQDESGGADRGRSTNLGPPRPSSDRASDRLHGGEELPARERLHEDRSRRQGVSHDWKGKAGDEEDGNGSDLPPQLPSDPESPGVREQDVDDRDIRVSLPAGLQGVGPRGRREDLEARLAQSAGHGVAKGVVVLDDEHPRGIVAHGDSSFTPDLLPNHHVRAGMPSRRSALVAG